MVALGLIVAVAACDDDTSVAPPDPPPQITVSQNYSKGSNGLPSADVFALLALSDTLSTKSDGEFWVGTELGVARYGSIAATSRIGDDVQNVAVGKSLSPGGVVVSPGPNGQLETRPNGDDLVNGTNVIDGGNGVAETAKNNTAVINELNGLPNPKVRDMAELNGKVYVATWGGGFAIYDMVGDTWTSRGVADGLRHGSIADIEVSRAEGRVYCATNDNVSIYTPSTDTFSEFINLTEEVTSSVEVRDTPGGVERWYGPRVESLGNTGDLGITVSRGSAVYVYTPDNSGLPEPNVNAIYYDDVDKLFWVAVSTQGVSSVDVDNSIWTNYTTVEGLPSNTVYSVTRAAAPGGGSTIWVATQVGIARLESDGTWQGYAASGGLSADRVRRVYSDNGSNLWCAYINDGAARLNPTSAQ
jgi:ligand-binding sensor domain-containing protein